MLIQGSGELTRKRFCLFVIIAIILVLLLPLAQTTAQEGEDPDEPRTVDSNAFPVIPVEPGVYPDQAGASTVLIIEDVLPWGLDSIQHVLANHGVGFTTINSTQIAATNLAPYKMVVVPSSQDYSGSPAFYNNWNANIAKIESYVNAGGKLWLSTCNQSSTEPFTPGGVISANDTDNFDEVLEPFHPWMWGAPTMMHGGSASHDSLTNLYPGSKVLARTEDSGKAVVVDYKYGAGRVFLSGMTLDYHYYANWAGKPIFVNSLTKMLDIKPIRALIIQDSAPWGTGIQDTLNRLKVGYGQVTSASMGSVDLRPFDVIIIPSNQGTTYYNNWNANYNRFHSFASAGSKLWLSAANQPSNPEPILPGGVTGADDLESYNQVVTPSHPWVQGTPARIFGNYASHDSFSNLVAGSITVVKAENTGKPTLVDYAHGYGRVMVNGLVLEWGWVHNQDNRLILAKSLQNLLGIPFFVNAPLITKNYCAWNLPGELEPNNAEGAANGPLCDNKTFTSKANDAFDWYYFNWNGQGTVRIDVRDFTTIGQVNLYYQNQASGRLEFAFDQPSGDYDVDYTGTGKAGKYLIMVFSGNPGNQDYTIKVDIP